MSPHMLLIALLAFTTTPAPAASNKVLYLIRPSHNQRSRLPWMQDEQLGSLHRRVRQRLGVIPSEEVVLTDKHGRLLQSGVVGPGETLWVRDAAVQAAQARSGQSTKPTSSSNREVAQSLSQSLDALDTNHVSSQKVPIEGKCEDSLENLLAPRPLGALLFKQGVQVVTQHGERVEYIEFFRNQDPLATARKWCSKFMVDDCRNLEQALSRHLERRIVDENRWRSYDGQGTIEMLMW